jgi:ABC-type nitrate/sulfonate/bicarbonate transport system ATPase subunit
VSGGRRAVRVVAEGLDLAYGGPEPARLVVQDLSLSLEPGDRVALVGASGTGKTTVLHAMAGLLAPARGRVTVDGVTVVSSRGVCTSRHAAYMFQRDLLLPWKSALENVAFASMVACPDGEGDARGRVPAHARRAEVLVRAEELLREFGLGHALHAFPRQLSGGMRQRVALARTLLLGRGLILLDEPFAGLDALTRADLHVWLREVLDGHFATWVLVTHDLREAASLAERVAVLGGEPASVVGWVDTRSDAETGIVELERLLAAARPR